MLHQQQFNGDVLFHKPYWWCNHLANASKVITLSISIFRTGEATDFKFGAYAVHDKYQPTADYSALTKGLF